MPPQSPPPASPLTHYELLELTPAASPGELRQAFRALSKRYHPDTTTLPAAQAREAFARLRQAYAVLVDPSSRAAYDAELQRRRLAALSVALPPPLPSLPRRSTPIGVRRSLSGGEWFALVLLALALVLSLVLGVGLAWARGLALVTQPSWWSEAGAAGSPAAAVSDGPAPQPAAAAPQLAAAVQTPTTRPAAAALAPAPELSSSPTRAADPSVEPLSLAHESP